MTDPATLREFLEAEIEALEPLAFVALGTPGRALQFVEVARSADGTLEVRIPGRPPGFPEIGEPERSVLADQGFTSEKPADSARPWSRRVRDAREAVDVARGLSVALFGAKPDAPVDVLHGSHQAEHEASQRLAELRKRLEPLLTAIVGRAPEQDADGDYLIPVADVRVVIAPRVAPRGLPVLRIFTVTNLGVSPSPELAVLLARLNFGLMFGRFVLDVAHQTIWFDETLIGSQFGEEELRFVIELVASTGDQWDDRLKQLFGGVTYQEALASREEREVAKHKPGEGGYL
jgi:hypothetical protein